MFRVNSTTYAANSVAANTDITSNLIPANANGFNIIAFEINCSVAAKIEVNGTDKVICAPDRSGYTARVNMGGPFFVEIEKIKIIDACNVNSLTAYYTVDGFKTKLGAPVFDHASGAYTLPFKLTMTSNEETASIYYTTNGATPTTSSTLYTSPIEIDTAGTVKAIAVAPGDFANSDVTSGVYTQLKVATPTASPAAGEVESGTTVTLACTTPDAVIKYKLDGGAEQTYSAPIEITEAVTITAHAELEGATNSDTLTAAYTVTGK